MDIYKYKSSWKLLLAIIAAIIVIISMIYSQYLAKKLAEREDLSVEIYVEALKNTLEAKQEDEQILTSVILDKVFPTIPIILESEDGSYSGFHIDGSDEITDQEVLTKKVNNLTSKGFVPFEASGYASYIYYDRSRLYYLIKWFPLAQILLLSTFILFAYYLFSASRRSEQNRVWAGMAKETAHQLGTPISAILGWIQYLKDVPNQKEENLEIVNELGNDVKRLELIADRFSKIGSKPDLTKTNLEEELNECIIYMKRRASKGVRFSMQNNSNSEIHVMINSHLFDWVIENLLRNALDAMDGKGKISIRINNESNKAVILLSDTGKGINASNQKLVFNPGFTTKKRGWGLGLSLAKRIIENYHDGKIFVKSSKTNEGTTFAIHLPLA